MVNNCYAGVHTFNKVLHSISANCIGYCINWVIAQVDIVCALCVYNGSVSQLNISQIRQFLTIPTSLCLCPNKHPIPYILYYFTLWARVESSALHSIENRMQFGIQSVNDQPMDLQSMTSLLPVVTGQVFGILGSESLV